MFQYYYRILDKYAKPITAFAIFTDNNKVFKPSFYEREFLGTWVYYGCNAFKIIEQDDAELMRSNNPFAMTVLSAKIAIISKRDQHLFDELRYIQATVENADAKRKNKKSDELFEVLYPV